MNYLVYKTTNLVNGKLYIGAHKTPNTNDGYIGSGKALQHAIIKYGIENFSREIIANVDSSEEMYQLERELVNEKFVNNPNTYNIKIGGDGGFDYINENGLGIKTGIPCSDEAKKKIAEKAKGRTHSEVTKAKMRENNWARKQPTAQREHAVRAASLPKSSEHKRKISESLKGKRKGQQQRTLKCPHCDKIGGVSNMKRWHFDNCKLRA